MSARVYGAQPESGASETLAYRVELGQLQHCLQAVLDIPHGSI